MSSLLSLFFAGDSKQVDELNYPTPIALYLNSELHSKHNRFILLFFFSEGQIEDILSLFYLNLKSRILDLNVKGQLKDAVKGEATSNFEEYVV